MATAGLKKHKLNTLKITKAVLLIKVVGFGFAPATMIHWCTHPTKQSASTW